MDHHNRDFFIAVITLGIITSGSWLLSPLHGANTGHLSIINILLPSCAAISQTLGGIVFTCFFIVRFFTQKILITKGLPTLAACLAVGTKHSKTFFVGLMIALPLCLMGAFIYHPVGNVAWTYSLYWFIPVAYGVFFLSNFRSLFFHMLATTFIAHAVGSVIWIYSIPSIPTLWLGLIPLVAVERLVFASGITLCIIFLKALHFDKLHARFRLSQVEFK